jgi:hypothetical protein
MVRPKASGSGAEHKFENESVTLIDNASGVTKRYPYFDFIFPPTATNEDVWKQLELPIREAIVERVMESGELLILGFGGTSTGKTYLFASQHDSEQPSHLSLIPRTINYVFDRLEKNLNDGFTRGVELSILEIYGNQTFDHNGHQIMSLDNIKWQFCQTADQAIGMFRASITRQQGDKSLGNSSSGSSRSHYIFSVRIAGSHRVIRLVDLASNEEMSDCKDGDQRKVDRDESVGNLVRALDTYLVRHMSRPLLRVGASKPLDIPKTTDMVSSISHSIGIT